MYTIASPIVGYQPIAAGWRAALIAHGAAPDATTILTSYDQWARAYHLDPNLAIAQACHECTWFTSTRWKDWNPAGLGVVSDNAVVKPFASPQEGIQAHAEHLCCHGYTITECPCDHAHLSDRRHFFHVGNAALADIQTAPYRWAAGLPGSDPQDYVRSIVSIANSIVGASPVSNVPTPADLGYPGKVHYATGSGETMNIKDVRFFIVHDTEGGFAGSEAALAGQISAHLLIDESGEWRFMVPLTSVAYAVGNLAVNRLSINVEHVGYADGRDGGYTDAQYRCCAAFYRFCVANGMTGVPATYIGRQDADGGPLPDAPGIIGHMDVPDGSGGWGGVDHHSDPGPIYEFDTLIAYIGGSPMPQPPVPNPDVLTIKRPDGTSFDVAYGFLHNLYEDVPAPKRLLHFGYPRSNDVAAEITDADGGKWRGRAQFWERAVFLHDPRNPPGIWQDYIARQDQLIVEVQ